MAQIKYGFSAEDIIKEGRVSENDINLITVWLRTEKCPELTQEQIVLFLLSCLCDLENTKSTISSFYAVRKSAPGLFNDRKISRPDLQKQLKVMEYCVFPKLTDDGYAIIFHRLYDTVYSNYDMEPAMKLLFMTLDAVIYDHPPKGLVVLFDMKGVGLMHLTRVKLGLVRTFFNYLQDGLRIRLQVVHVLNSVYFIDKVLNLIKPFIKKEVMEMLHLHPTNMDMDEFHEKWLPKRCLPLDFGGDLSSVRNLHEENTQKLMEMQTYFAQEELQRANSPE